MSIIQLSKLLFLSNLCPHLKLILFLPIDSKELVEIGKFQSYSKDTNGDVFVKDDKTLMIKGFTYSGTAPDAFFWAGTSPQPSPNGIILPYPFTGMFYNYDDKSAPVLGKFTNAEVVLTLPDNLKTTDIKWLSVWCREFEANFGDIFFPEDLSIG